MKFIGKVYFILNGKFSQFHSSLPLASVVYARAAVKILTMLFYLNDFLRHLELFALNYIWNDSYFLAHTHLSKSIAHRVQRGSISYKCHNLWRWMPWPILMGLVPLERCYRVDCESTTLMEKKKKCDMPYVYVVYIQKKQWIHLVFAVRLSLLARGKKIRSYLFISFYTIISWLYRIELVAWKRVVNDSILKS